MTSISLTPAETGECGDDDAAEEDQHPGYQQDVSGEKKSQTSCERGVTCESVVTHMRNMKVAVATLPLTRPTWVL